MAAEVADRLHALVRDYAEGRLTLAAYRRLRAPLLDGLVGIPAAAPSPDRTQPRGAARPTAEGSAGSDRAPEPDEGLAADRGSQPHPSNQQIRTRRPDGRGRIIALTAAILGSVAVFFAWRHATQGRAPAAVTSSPASGRAAADSDPIQALLQPLIDNPDWSDARLTALDAALLEAGPKRIAAEQGTGWFNVFVDEVRNRVKEQQALEGTPLSPGKSPLAALAVTLGIDLTSPDRPIGIGVAGSQSALGAVEHASMSPAPTNAPRVVEAPASAARERVERTEATPGGRAPVGTAAARLNTQVTGAAVSAAATAASAATAAASPPATSGSAAVTGASGGAQLQQQSAPARAAGTASPAAPPRSASIASNGERCSAELVQSRHTYCRDTLSTGVLGPLLAVIPPGSFQMGNDEAAGERPVHRVTIARPFAMSVYEISQDEFRQYCRASGKPCPVQPWAADDYPVVKVSWNDARDYTRWLSQATGQVYRLPTEAEWEYAARAGQTGLYPSGDTLSPTDAYFSMGETLTAPAHRSQPINANAWRLLNMVGDVREWVEDGWSPNFSGAPTDGSAWQDGSGGIKVVRGGSYADHAIELRLTTRGPLSAGTRDKLTGIRIVREIR